MIKLEQKDNHKLKISRIIHKNNTTSIDVYLFTPKELDLNQNIIAEYDCYHKLIHSKHTYYNKRNDLPIVQNRLAIQGKISLERYRLKLSLYAYQYVTAMESTVQRLLSENGTTTSEEIENIINLAQRIIKKLRQTAPSDKKLLKYFENIDNYLSWFTSQQCMMLIAHLPRNPEYSNSKKLLLDFHQQETQYTTSKKYNSEKVMTDANRMVNKMRLLRLLLENPITIKEKQFELGKNTRKLITGFSAGFVMVIVTLILVSLRDALKGVTAPFIFVIALTYAFRDIFKDDLKQMLWKWMRKGKPEWRKLLLDPTSNSKIGNQFEWFSYSNFSNLPSEIQKIRKYKISQRDELVLHYKNSTQISMPPHLGNYDQIKESMIWDLGIFSNLIGKEAQKIYELNRDQVSKKALEKRYLFNLVIKESNDKKTTIQRWKVIMSRSKILDIEPIVN